MINDTHINDIHNNEIKTILGYYSLLACWLTKVNQLLCLFCRDKADFI